MIVTNTIYITNFYLSLEYLIKKKKRTLKISISSVVYCIANSAVNITKQEGVIKCETCKTERCEDPLTNTGHCRVLEIPVPGRAVRAQRFLALKKA